MTECEHLIGRPRDLCEGQGRDGRPNPTQELCDQRRDSMGLPRIVVENPSQPTMQISEQPVPVKLKKRCCGK